MLRGKARANLLPEPKRYLFVIERKGETVEVEGTDAIEYFGTLIVYDEKVKVAMIKDWMQVLRKEKTS